MMGEELFFPPKGWGNGWWSGRVQDRVQPATGNSCFCLGESPATAFQAPSLWDGSHVQRVTNAPKQALLMKKLRGRVANVWAVNPTKRGLCSSVGGREELVYKITSDTL